MEHLTQAVRQTDALVQRSSVTALIGGTQANGIRLRAVLSGEGGNADVNWLVLNGKLIHLVYVGSDAERARADDAWSLVCNPLRVGSAPPTPPIQLSPPPISIITVIEDSRERESSSTWTNGDAVMYPISTTTPGFAWHKGYKDYK